MLVLCCPASEKAALPSILPEPAQWNFEHAVVLNSSSESVNRCAALPGRDAMPIRNLVDAIYSGMRLSLYCRIDTIM